MSRRSCALALVGLILALCVAPARAAAATPDWQPERQQRATRLESSCGASVAVAVLQGLARRRRDNQPRQDVLRDLAGRARVSQKRTTRGR